jgi:hypothetical protein
VPLERPESLGVVLGDWLGAVDGVGTPLEEDDDARTFA